MRGLGSPLHFVLILAAGSASGLCPPLLQQCPSGGLCQREEEPTHHQMHSDAEPELLGLADVDQLMVLKFRTFGLCLGFSRLFVSCRVYTCCYI